MPLCRANYCARIALIEIALGISVPEDAVLTKFVRASGPGGQHVNKVSTAVELRLDLEKSQLPQVLQKRLSRLAGQRLNAAREIVIFAQTHRSQARNIEEAFRRLEVLVTNARKAPRRRVPTKPSRSAKRRTRELKSHRGTVKRGRRRPDSED
jgi:ribosome-associated protein